MSENLPDSSEAQGQNTGGQPESPPVPQLFVEAAETFNYAAWQNAVPLLQGLRIENPGGLPFSSLVVEMTAVPGFARDRRWMIDRIGPGETLTLKDIDIEVDPSYLNQLDEAERGILNFQLSQKEMAFQEVRRPLRILARDEWGGMPTMSELLPAFVTPNDPALAPLLRSAAAVLGEHGHSTALDGYQSGDPNRAYLLAASLWSALAARSLVYANPPSSFERVGQKTRSVASVLNDGLATCLDSTLLFASALEAIGLNAVIVMLKGHCFVGVWLVKKSFRRLVEPDCSELRKAIAAKELIVFETTLVTHTPPGRFEDAERVAVASVAVEKEHDFIAVVDVARARLSEIRPLASHGARDPGTIGEEESRPLPLPASPEISQPILVESEELPQTPAGRIERWQRKLLDLSLRNRLLNFRMTKQTIPVLCPNVSRLEDRLADGGRMRLVSLSEGNRIGQRSSELHQQRTQKDLDWEFASRSLEQNEVVCPLEPRDLESRLVALHRQVRNDMAEGGSNTLYLAVGFLRWKPDPNVDKDYRAPLLLVPVKLLRRSVSSPFYLGNHEDEVRFNATLLQLLKKDFDCDLSSFEAELPMDDSGVDVPQVFDRVRRAIREIPGFEILEETAIATFSFAKYLMWKDLVDRVDQLKNNRVVNHLIENPHQPFENHAVGAMPRPSDMDQRYSPQEIVHPLPADSSQLASVMAASEGHDMVIVGPPGTGKSQTIANIIAQCLAIGKSVLFVAEKTAALDVVHRRLKAIGLGDCCVELHSNKAERRRFLDQLEASWENRQQENTSEWVTINEQLCVRRDQLNAYAAAVHMPEPSGWTPFHAMGICVRGRDVEAPTLSWPMDIRHDRSEYEELKATLAELALAFAALPANSPAPRICVSTWSMGWETSFIFACQQVEKSANSLTNTIESQASGLGFPISTDISSKQLSQLYRLVTELAHGDLPPSSLLQHSEFAQLVAQLAHRGELLQSYETATQSLDAELDTFQRVLGTPVAADGQERQRRPLFQLANELLRGDLQPFELVFHPQFDTLRATLSERHELLSARVRALEALRSRSFNPLLIDRIPIDSLEKNWLAATTSFWPLSTWKTLSLRKQLQGYMQPPGVAEQTIDLPLLIEYRDACEQLARNLSDLGLPANLAALVAQDAHGLDHLLEQAQKLRSVFTSAGIDLDGVRRGGNGKFDPLIAAARRLFPPGREYESLRKRCKENLTELALPPELKSLVEKDATALDSFLQSAEIIRQAMEVLSSTDNERSQMLSGILASDDESRQRAAKEILRSIQEFQDSWSEYRRLANTTPADSDSPSLVVDAAEQAQRILAHRTILKQWTVWTDVRRRAEALGLETFVEVLQSRELEPSDIQPRFELAYARWCLPAIVDRRQPLRMFQRFLHEDAIADFRRLDELARKSAAPRVRNGVLHDLPPSASVPRKSELGLLRHQMNLKRPSRSIREIISGMPDTFAKLAPCLLMSPLSIAQYLPADHPAFDVVIFDEASQITTWDAIGAIARGRQTIIVGDPKQLPPTNFFGKADSDAENSELEDYEKDLESILDETKASGLPTLQLNWHYRSRHESLIAFSNWNYYGNNLVTFPAAESEDRGVTFHHVADAVYDRGKSRTNRKEAEAIVASAMSRMKRCLRKPEEERLTYGVVTFNGQQQALIQDLFDEALRNNSEVEWFFSDDRIEPTVVKNLENVQGDERDVMMFSITFGFDSAGKFSNAFGAINRDGGERRLNVAVTRARQELAVYCSFLPDQVRAERTAARGVHDLKAFLEYAQKGPQAIIARTDGSVGDLESPLEEAIATELTARGWRIDPQVGVSGFRIDLGVIHPDKRGAYLAGIECDGATYHRSAAARDRDKTRQQVLEQLGWNILRVWSTEWWYDSESAIARIHQELNRLLELSRQQPEWIDETPSNSESEVSLSIATEGTWDTEDGSADLMAFKSDDDDVTESPLSDGAEPDSGIEDLEEVEELSLLVASQSQTTERLVYPQVELDDATGLQSQFFDDGYATRLQKMIVAVLETCAPIREDVLVREIARAHGFGRSGARIKERVLRLLPPLTISEEPVGNFLWLESAVAPYIPFRYPATGSARRPIDEIPLPELIGLVRENPVLAASDDPALALAREIGLGRLARGARERLELALEAAATDD